MLKIVIKGIYKIPFMLGNAPLQDFLIGGGEVRANQNTVIRNIIY